MALTGVNFNDLLPQTPFKELDDMYAAIGAGDYRVTQAVALAQRELEPEEEKAFEIRTRTPQEKVSDSTITIDGVGNLLTQMAGCCHPVPGDPIIGYITIGRGVTIHRQDCNNALNLQEKEPERLIEVNWGYSPEYMYPVEIIITAYDRSGLLRDITIVLANERVNVLSVQTRTSKEDNIANMLLTVEVQSLQQLSTVLAKVNQLPNVIEVARYRKEGK